MHELEFVQSALYNMQEHVDISACRVRLDWNSVLDFGNGRATHVKLEARAFVQFFYPGGGDLFAQGVPAREIGFEQVIHPFTLKLVQLANRTPLSSLRDSQNSIALVALWPTTNGQRPAADS